MVRIVVFDSGLGSLSVIKAIQKQFKCTIIYFADLKNFPYGKKTIKEIRNITSRTILILQKTFEPELIVVGSNTLSFTLDSCPKNILPVLHLYKVQDQNKIYHVQPIQLVEIH